MLHRATSRFSSSGNEDPAKSISKLKQDFEIGETLGAGQFGQIFKTKQKCDDNEYAIKIIKFDSNLEDIESIKREAKLLSQLNHNNIVRYYNSWIEMAEIPVSEYEKFKNENSLSSEILKLSQDGRMSNEDRDNSEFDCEDSYYDEDFFNEDEENDDDDSCVVFQPELKLVKYLFIQMELCDKRSLRTEIDNNLYLDEGKLSKYFREICEGLAHIHRYSIVHRDLKPDNIFLTAENVIKIGDFGLSKQITLENYLEYEHNDGLPYGSLTGECGTLIYIAPEIRTGNRFNVKADIYSLGVIYFEMCSKPMTNMEKQTVFFPLTFQKWKNMFFFENSVRKKNLIKNLLQINHHKRPTCEEILKVINSPKSMDEFKKVLQQNSKVSNQEWKTFERAYSTCVEQAEPLQVFLSTATKVFEQHGGKNVCMPSFIPSVNHFPANLTTLLNTQGNSTSVSNTSKIAFCYYLASHNIRTIRRYSVGKVYEEGPFSPSEVQECVFEAVSSYRDDHVLDAEVIFIAEKIHQDISPRANKIYFVFNHGTILLSIFKHCRISKEFGNSILNMLSNPNKISQMFSYLDSEVKEFLLAINKKFSLAEAETLLTLFKNNNQNQKFAKINISRLKKVLTQMKEIEDCARKFGVKSPIYLMPFFTKKMFCGEFMFKMAISEENTLASGGRFHSLIKKCCRKKRKKIDVSAVDVSFHVENVLEMLSLFGETGRTVDVVILAENKSLAIPLYAELLSKNIKCEIEKELIIASSQTKRPSVVIYVSDEQVCRMVSARGIEWKFKPIFQGNWRHPDFFKSLYNNISSDAYKSYLNHVGQILKFRLQTVSERNIIE